MRWLPVNTAAKILYQEIRHSLSSGKDTDAAVPHYYHLENEQSTSWKTVVDAIRAFTHGSGSRSSVESVNMADWLRQAESRAEEGSNVSHLLEFYETYVDGSLMPPLDLTHARLAARDLVHTLVGQELVELYVAFACA